MDALLITSGLFLRTIFLAIKDFTKIDVWKLSSIVLFAVAAAVLGEDLYVLPLSLAFVVAFLYQDKIVPALTEGTLLLYGLIALFLYAQSNTLLIPSSVFEWIVSIFLLVFTVAALVFCLTKIRPSYTRQVVTVVMFLLVSIYIAYQGTLSYMPEDPSALGMVLIGFYSLHFISNIIYVLYFIPIPGKHQSFKDRLKDIKKHATELEKKYHDRDTHYLRTVGILTLFTGLVAYNYFFNDWFTAMAFTFIVGSFLVQPPANTIKNTPSSNYNQHLSTPS